MMSRPSAVSDKRQHIIDTAYALFKHSGFHATGIDRIIAEANVAKMTMYRHFPNKDGLIVEVLAHRARRFDRQLDRLGEEPASAEQKIDAIFDWYEFWFQRPDFRGCLFAHALAEFGDPAHPVFQAAFQQKHDLKRRLQKILDDAMPPDRSEPVSAAVLMLIEGATLLAEMGRPDLAIENARRAAATLIAASRIPL
jgi:AcrR family transcriptional regulator